MEIVPRRAAVAEDSEVLPRDGAAHQDGDQRAEGAAFLSLTEDVERTNDADVHAVRAEVGVAEPVGGGL